MVTVAYSPKVAGTGTVSLTMGTTAVSGVTSFTVTNAAGTFKTYVNGNQVSVGPSHVTGRKKRLRQVSGVCCRQLFKSHERCSGALGGSRKPGEGLWCACYCHPEPVPPTAEPSLEWLEARTVWDAARRSLDLASAASKDKSFRAACLSALRRSREEADRS
jgi:hypothetical protein